MKGTVVRESSVWRRWRRGRGRTPSSGTARSAGITGGAPTAGATSPKARLATTQVRGNSRWTTPNGRRGSDPTPTSGQIYRSRSATPGLDRLSTTRRIVSDVGAIVAVLAALILMAVAVWWLLQLTDRV